MRASEFALDEGKASRRKQASMNAQRRASAAPTQAPAQAPTQAPAQAPTQAAPVSATANYAQKPIAPTSSSDYSGGQRQVTPTMTAPQAPQPKGADWAGLTQATTPTAAAAPSYLDRIRQKMSSAGKGIADRFSTQGKISKRTDEIFVEKFLKDMKEAERTTTRLRGDQFIVKDWINQYLAQNRWDAGEYQQKLDQAVAVDNRKAIASVMAAIGKYNNLGSTMRSKTAASKATASGTQAMGQMATQLTKPLAGTVGGAGAMGQMASQLTAPTASTAPKAAPTPGAGAMGQMASQLGKPVAPAAAATPPGINPDGSITIAGAKGEAPSKIMPGDPLYKSLYASITKQAKV